ncbi:MAG: cupin, partial [SAR86 cluster bacterium]|nr:cupin [SAR86 cluster bacterium]
NPKLELDDGETVDLEPGDVVIQNGTRHAWRFKDDEVTTMLWVLIGTKRN